MSKQIKATKDCPAAMVINNGVITMEDGSDPTAYLAAWQKRTGVKNGEHVNVVDHVTMLRVKEDCALARAWGS